VNTCENEAMPPGPFHTGGDYSTLISFVPWFIEQRPAGISTRTGLYPPSASYNSVFPLRQFFKAIPHEISESAAIDTGHLRIFWQISSCLYKLASATFILDFLVELERL